MFEIEVLTHDSWQWFLWGWRGVTNHVILFEFWLYMLATLCQYPLLCGIMVVPSNPYDGEEEIMGGCTGANLQRNYERKRTTPWKKWRLCHMQYFNTNRWSVTLLFQKTQWLIWNIIKHAFFCIKFPFCVFGIHPPTCGESTGGIHRFFAGAARYFGREHSSFGGRESSWCFDLLFFWLGREAQGQDEFFFPAHIKLNIY